MSALSHARYRQAVKKNPLTLVAPVVRNNFSMLTKLAGALGFFVILNLVLGIVIQNNDYQLSHLIKEQQALAVQSDVVSAEYDSLSSNQNLVDVAHSLGMVSNVNPVFLKLSDSTIIGQPKRALANQRSVAPNLVPNAAQTAYTDTSKLATQTVSSVLGSNHSTSVVASGVEDTIQASPTN